MLDKIQHTDDQKSNPITWAKYTEYLGQPYQFLIEVHRVHSNECILCQDFQEVLAFRDENSELVRQDEYMFNPENFKYGGRIFNGESRTYKYTVFIERRDRPDSGEIPPLNIKGIFEVETLEKRLK